ncbi:LysR family transcriptional regulator [Gluconobacter cerinus]
MNRKYNIKIRHLNVIKHIYKIQNLKKTSEVMSLTPAAISKTCIEFEKIIGKTLFSRTIHGLIPNEIAKRVVESSILIEKEIDRMIIDIDNIYNEKNYVNISFQSNSIISEMMKCILSIVSSKNVNFTVNYGSREHLFSSLLKGRTDIIFASAYNDIIDDRINYKYLIQDKCVIIDKDRAYSMKEIVRNWDSFQSKVWVLPIRGTAMRDRFDSILEYNGLKTPKNLIELNSIIGASSLIDNPDTIGMSTISYLKSVKYKFEENKNIEDLSDITLNVGVYWRQDSKKLVSEVVDFFIHNMDLNK